MNWSNVETNTITSSTGICFTTGSSTITDEDNETLVSFEKGKKPAVIALRRTIIMNQNTTPSTDTTSTSSSNHMQSDAVVAWEEWMSRFTCRIATPNDTVYSQECVYTFHTPFTNPKGILVNCKTFIGSIESMAMIQHSNHQNNNDDENNLAIFVRIVKDYVTKEISTTTMNENDTTDPMIPTKLGIGVEGGFQTEEDQYETTTRYAIVVVEQPPTGHKRRWEFPYTIDESISHSPPIPFLVQQSVNSIIHHVGAAIQNDVQAWSADQDAIPISKYCDTIPYIDNGITIDPHPSSWKCQSSNNSQNDNKGDAETNVWLNLSDGYMGGGRKHWDVRFCVCVVVVDCLHGLKIRFCYFSYISTSLFLSHTHTQGSGGTNGALDHYNETGRQYPLVVKLGTITSDITTADCYSYAPDEDGPVKITNLLELLQKRGIHVATMYVVNS